MQHQAAALIDLSALVHNYHHAKSLAPNSKTMAVIKADAYGHGVLQAAAALTGSADGVDGIAVANVGEGVRLRQNGVGIDPLLILQGANDPMAFQSAIDNRLQIMVQNEIQLNFVLSNGWPAALPVWLKVDSGMHRLGVNRAQADKYIPLLQAKFGPEGFVIASHFACSDEVGLDFTQQQLDDFLSIRKAHNVIQWSIANSGAILALPEAHGTWNRSGFMTYGNSPLSTPHENDKALRPVMTVTAPVIAVRTVPVGECVGYSRTWTAERESRIATLAVGYGDGYPRHAKNGTPVIINGQRCKLAGRVSMDMITVDVTDVKDAASGEWSVREGDIAYLWGPLLPVNEVAEWAGTIGYELLTKVTPRLKKTYST